MGSILNPTPTPPSSGDILSLNVEDLHASYTARKLSPVDVIRHVYAKISTYPDPAVWIYLVPLAEALTRAEELVATYYQHDSHDDRSTDPLSLPPLFGMPFSVKDSIDIAGLSTTLACPSFAYTATETAPVIARILAAGGILIGKTNLDQFATGLAGVRSPYGAPRCVFDGEYISGGSSSGSAVSVAASLVSFTVCTDTGGSTRVPAALNGLVGLKPTLGTVSAVGLVPACKNIDCVCVMGRTVRDVHTVWDVIRAFDERDVFARRHVPEWPAWGDPVRFAIPPAHELHDHLSPAYAALFGKVVATLRSQSQSDHSPWCIEAGTATSNFDYHPFAAANQMLYDSSIVAQRLLAFDAYISSHGLDADDLHPAIRTTFQQALDNGFSAVRAYDDIFRLAGLRRHAEVQFRECVDVLVVPSTVDHFTVAQLDEEPMVRNKVMGRFTNFVNLLDLAAVSVPVGWWIGGNGKKLPFGVTVVGQAGKDREIMAFGERVMRMMAAEEAVWKGS
ncbi:allophanate hydrolase [Cladophialophora carrionii CBS 160.54]|uniref:Allophanate hydrolase n=1 Tax=Cladophialophora carrionii CBS 160.54 TaxID=1279043 RepID=V9DH49_9EURO|nr:allophanate hydrolase [Cladophialophora carrionii CBS 160.54]ETI26219.1 allophanate hydrolase [Cladophialophora carrionii CBS 160.54]